MNGIIVSGIRMYPPSRKARLKITAKLFRSLVNSAPVQFVRVDQIKGKTKLDNLHQKGCGHPE